MLLYLLTLRMRMAGRLLAEIGIGRILLISILGLPGILKLGQMIAFDPNGGYLLAAIHIGTVLSIHQSRRDTRMLRLAQLNPRRVFAGSYLAFCIPLLPAYIWTGPLWLPIAVPAVLALISLLPAGRARKLSSRPPMRQPFLPIQAFEWRGGMRQHGWLLVVVYLLALGLSYLHPVIPISILVISLLSLSFYTQSEPRILLEAPQLGARAYLRLRLKLALGIYAALCAPLFLLMVVLHPDWWQLGLAAWVAGSIMTIYAVLAKYALYMPGDDLSGRLAFLFGIAIVCLFNPFHVYLVPVPLVMAYRFYYKSVKNLSFYLHAYGK